MTERPILFSAPMVRAILAGTKLQTRRVIMPQPKRQNGKEAGDVYVSGHHDYPVTVNIATPGGYRPVPLRCPYGVPGDRLWVRETFAVAGDDRSCIAIAYRADGEAPAHAANLWRPSIYMPRWASRLMLEVTGIRVERVQNVSEEDARAEGATPPYTDWTHRDAFRALWDTINAKRGYGWDTNPWVWVVEFRRLDSAARAKEGGA